MKDECTTFFLFTIATLSAVFETLSCPCKKKTMIRDASTVVILARGPTIRGGDSWWWINARGLWFLVVNHCLVAVFGKVIIIGEWIGWWPGKIVWWSKFCFFSKVWYKFKYMIECNCWHERWMHHLLSYHNFFFILYIWDLIWPMWKINNIRDTSTVVNSGVDSMLGGDVAERR